MTPNIHQTLQGDMASSVTSTSRLRFIVVVRTLLTTDRGANAEAEAMHKAVIAAENFMIGWVFIIIIGSQGSQPGQESSAQSS